MLYTIIVGAIVGWLAGKFMNQKNGLLKNIIIGVLGGVLGGLLFGLLGFAATNIIGYIIISTVGACLLIWLMNKYMK